MPADEIKPKYAAKQYNDYDTILRQQLNLAATNGGWRGAKHALMALAAAVALAAYSQAAIDSAPED